MGIKMIDEKRTFKEFGYYSTDLEENSGKRVVVVCDNCKRAYTDLEQCYKDICIECRIIEKYPFLEE